MPLEAMNAYYNENDPNAAAWIRELIKDGLVTDGEVDERSIEDVVPADLVRFDRCHFFAGIAAWDYALQLAGWPDERRVWTGSCPCQPFSSAGKREGFDDERHLWPAWFHIIDAYRRSFGYVPAIFGEQVASKDGLAWLDVVQTDLESIGYAVAPVDIPVAGVGGPHRRQRLFFVADSEHARHDRPTGIATVTDRDKQRERLSHRDRKSCIVALTDGGNSGTERIQRSGEQRQQQANRSTDHVGNSVGSRLQRARGERSLSRRSATNRHGGSTGPVNGYWGNCEWIYCRDEKYRPVESGTFPLAYGLPAGMGRLSPKLRRLAAMAGLDSKSLKRAKGYRLSALRGYGNAISPQVAEAFIRSYLEILND